MGRLTLARGAGQVVMDKYSMARGKGRRTVGKQASAASVDATPAVLAAALAASTAVDIFAAVDILVTTPVHPVCRRRRLPRESVGC